MITKSRFLLKICFLLFTMLFLQGAANTSAEKTLTLGVLAFRPKPETLARWQPLANYLTQRLHGIRIRLEVLDYAELEHALETKQLDFVFTNPGHYVLLRHKYNMSGPLATLVDTDGRTATDSFGGVIIARKDRKDINEIRDLKGKTIAAVTLGSFGGYQTQAVELLHAGINPSRDTRIFTTEMPHDKVVFSVLQGTADAGFVRTGVLEAMSRENKADLSRLKILARRDAPTFPYAVSTQLYPEWPIIDLPHVSDDISRRVAAALFEIEHNGLVAQRCKIHGFTVPADYAPVEGLLRELRLPPFDKSPAFTFQDVLQRYRYAVIALIIAALIISILTIRLVISNRRLVFARKTASEFEEKYQLLAENTSDVFWEINLSTNHYTYVSPAVVRLTGYTPDELMAQPFVSFLAPASIDNIREWIKRDAGEFAEGRDELQSPMRQIEHLCKDGKTIWIEVSATYTLDADKRPVAINGISRDITARRHAEEQLKRSLSLLKATLESTADGILVVANNGTIADFNEQFVKLWGIPKSILDLHDDKKALDFVLDQLQDPEQFIAKIRELYADLEAISLDILEFKDGRLFERHSQPQRIDGKPVGRVWSFRDITERRKNESALRQNEERYRALIEASSQIVWTCDTQGAITDYSPSWRAYTGQNLDQPGGYGYVECIHPDDREAVMAKWKDGLQKGISVNAELRLHHYSGEWRWNHVRAVPVLNKSGSVASWIGAYTDIHDRKQAEERIKKLAQELNTILATLTVGVSFIKDRRVQWSNAAHDRVFGYSPQESSGLDTSTFYADESGYKRVGAEGYAQLAKGEAYITEVEMKRKDGTRFWCSLTGRAVNPDNLEEGSIWMLQDITERKKAELELRESETKFRAIFEKSVDAIGISKTGVHTFVNPAYVALFGYASGDELTGRPVLDLIAPCERPTILERIWQRARGEAVPSNYETRGLKKDGAEFVMDVNASTYELSGSTYTLVILRDITERKNNENELIRAKAEWERTFDAITDPVMILDTNYHIIKANKAMADALGVTPAQAVGMTCYESVHGTAAPPDYCPHAKLLTDGLARSQEIYEPRLGGHYLITVSPLHAADGALIGSIHAARDISTIKNAEELSRKYSRDLERMLAVSRETTLTSDLRGLYRSFVAASKELLNLDFSTLMLLSEDKKTLTIQDSLGLPETVIGRFSLVEGQGLSTLVIKNRKPETVTDFSAESRFEVPLLVWENNVTSALAVPMMMKNEIIGVLIGHTLARREFSQNELDIYQHIANQAAVSIRNAMNTDMLRKNEKYVRDITASLGEGVYVLNANGEITFMNPEAEALLGWSEQELLHRNIHDIVHNRRADGSTLLFEDCDMRKVIETGNRFHSRDEVFVRKNGTVFPVSVFSTPLMENGKVVASVTAFRDIADRKHIEQEREKLIADLQKALADIKTLHGILPICASCKKIRDEQGAWHQLEQYISDHTDSQFSHGICKDCAKKLYPEYYKDERPPAEE